MRKLKLKDGISADVARNQVLSLGRFYDCPDCKLGTKLRVASRTKKTVKCTADNCGEVFERP